MKKISKSDRIVFFSNIVEKMEAMGLGATWKIKEDPKVICRSFTPLQGIHYEIQFIKPKTESSEHVEVGFHIETEKKEIREKYFNLISKNKEKYQNLFENTLIFDLEWRAKKWARIYLSRPFEIEYEDDIISWAAKKMYLLYSNFNPIINVSKLKKSSISDQR